MKRQDYAIKTVSGMHLDIKKAADTRGFTKDEAQQLLDIMIEDQCEWALRQYYPKAYANETKNAYAELQLTASSTDTSSEDAVHAGPTDEDIAKIANSVYRNIVKDWRYNDTVLEVCRKAKFNRQSVADKVVECADKMAAENGTVGKALGRSLLRVIESGVDIRKAVEYEDIVKSGVSKPERVYVFLNTVKGN